MRRFRLIICLILAGCAPFPELADTEGEDVQHAAYPRLLSANELGASPESRATLDVQNAVLARLATLEARAKRLKARPVIDPATRARMARGVQ